MKKAKSKFVLPKGSPPGDVLVGLMAMTLAEVCRDVPLNMDVATKNDQLLVVDPDQEIYVKKFLIRKELKQKDAMIARLIWYSLYSTYDGP